MRLEQRSDDRSRAQSGAAGPPGPVSERVRCRCLTCGAHVHAVQGVQLYGQCSNCGGVEFVPLTPPNN